MAKVCKRRGRYVLDFYDQNGVRQRITMAEDKTKKEAKKELRDIEEMVEKGTFLPIKKTPLFSEVAKDWLEFKKLNIRETYWEVCEGHVRNHFKDLDRMLINRITIATLEKYISLRQTQGMNINTLRRILVTLGQILSYGVRHGYIDYNPLKEVERPRRRGGDHEEGDKIKPINPEQIKTLLEHVSNQKYYTLFLTAIMTGARAGELLGLKWTDIEWNPEQPQVYIQRTFNKGRFFSPKTKNSRRKIDLAPAVVRALKKWRLACPSTELDLIFPNKAGSPMDSDNMTKRHFHPALKAAGLPRARFHDLRHTYASLMIEQGENIKYVQNQLGHASPTVTLNVYAHLMKPANQEAVCRLENTLFGGTGHKMVTMSEQKGMPIPVTG